MGKIKAKTGDIIATSARSILSQSIMLATDGKVSHLAVVYDDNYVIEARGDLPYHSVVKTPVCELIDRSESVHIIRTGVNPLFSTKSKQWLMARVGRKYDYFNTLVIQVIRIFGLGKLFQRKIKSAEKRYMCSELAVHYLKENRGLSLKWPKKSYNPSEVLERMSLFSERVK